MALQGSWRFHRVIADARTGQRLLATGTAVFEQEDAAIRWRESGTLALPTGEVPVTTERRIVRTGDGDWVVEFADGRPFHPWVANDTLTYDCAPDTYTGTLKTTAPDATWSMRWSASGPRKQNVIDTTYVRSDEV